MIDAGIGGLGEWKVLGKTLKVEYRKSSGWILFELPIRDGILKGVTEKGAAITATKVEDKS